MTLRLSYKNIAIIGLLQVGVIVAGVLGAGTLQRMEREWNLPLSLWTTFAGNYGFLVLAVPMIWVVLAMIVEGQEENDLHEMFGIYSGLLVLVLLLLGVCQAVVLPWVRLLNPWGLSVSSA